MDSRRFKNAEKQIVPEPFKLHILAGDHAEIQQHIAAHRQLHEVTGISLPGGEEHRPRCEAAAYVAEIQQVEQVVLREPQRDRHRFKVPGLRNIELTAPYFHDGSMATMDDAVRAMAKYQLGIDLPQQEVDKIVAFLRTLTGEYKGQLLTNKNMEI